VFPPAKGGGVATAVFRMKKPPHLAYAVTFLVVATLVAILASRPGSESAGPPAAANTVPQEARKSAPRPGGFPGRVDTPADAGAEPRFQTDDRGIVDTADYDADRDGYPEIATYVRIYGMLKSSAGKIDMLQNARILEPADDPVINRLIITEAARSEDPGIRSSARDALSEYGGEKARAAMADYMATQTGILDLEELKAALDRTGMRRLKDLTEDN
jgi:hypothetical protein